MPELPHLLTKLAVEAGQGELWLAGNEDPFGDEVVVKFLTINPDPGIAAEDTRRFAREVRCQSTLRHPGIMPILQYDVESSRPWYSMPKAGTTLDDVLRRTRISGEQMMSIIMAVMDAVEYAHLEGILHRDLKPANILYVSNPTAGNSGWVVADFGLCRDGRSASTRITRTHTMMGTIAYMAPEQFDDAHEVGPTADVHAIGKIIAHCLTGKVPFPYMPWDDIPDQFRQLVHRCVAEKPDDRYQSIAALRGDLITLAAGGDRLLNPLEEASRLLDEVQGGVGVPYSVASLVRLLTNNSTDDFLHIKLVPRVKRTALEWVQRFHPNEFSLIVRDFDRHMEGSFSFSYTDHVANFFESVYRIAQDESIKRLAARRILIIGHEHNRYYVRDAFCRIASIAQGPDAVTIAGLLTDLPGPASFIRDAGSDYRYAPVIRDALFPTPF